MKNPVQSPHEISEWQTFKTTFVSQCNFSIVCMCIIRSHAGSINNNTKYECIKFAWGKYGLHIFCLSIFFVHLVLLHLPEMSKE